MIVIYYNKIKILVVDSHFYEYALNGFVSCFLLEAVELYLFLRNFKNIFVH